MAGLFESKTIVVQIPMIREFDMIAKIMNPIVDLTNYDNSSLGQDGRFKLDSGCTAVGSMVMLASSAALWVKD